MINLSKGQSINLSKQPMVESKGITGLQSVKFGLDWGMIGSKGGFFGFGSTKEKVDLDASAVIIKNDGQYEIVYYGNLKDKSGNVKHSGDDRGGDEEDDGMDNEIITCNLSNMTNVKAVVFILNSFSGQDFGKLPYVRIRSFVGNSRKPSNSDIIASMELSNDSSMKGKKAMIMGTTVVENNEWIFKTIGEGSNNNTVNTLAKECIKFV